MSITVFSAILLAKEVVMARPKTEAATYEMVTFRVKPKVLAKVRRLIKKTGVPLNTELNNLVDLGLQVKEQAHTTEENYVAIGSRDN